MEQDLRRFINKVLFILLILPVSVNALNKIDRIEFQGNRSFNDKKLKSAIGYNRKVKYVFDDVSILKERIIDYYKRKGYLDADITVDFKKAKNKNIVLFIIDEKKLYKIISIEIKGNYILDKRRILKLSGLKINSPLDVDILRSSELNIGKEYSNLGYLYANIFTKINLIDDSNGNASLNILIDEGNKVLIRSIDINNPGKINLNVIERELEIIEGDECSYKNLIKSQSNIFETGLFRDVRFDIKGIKEKSDSVDIVFYLSPAKTHWIFGGIGYETPDIMAVRAEWGFNNLFNMNNWIQIHGRYAYSFHSGYIYEGRIFYLNPYFIIKKISFKIIGDLYNKNYINYIENRKYAEMSIGKQWVNNNFVSLNINFQIATYDSVIYGERISLNKYHTNSAYIDFNRDCTDNFIFPTNGYRYYTKLQYSGGILHGDNNLYKGYISFSLIKKYNNFILFFKNQIGIIKVFGASISRDISYDQKFTLGGPYNLRGYEQNSIGFRDPYGNIGGNALFCSNIGISSPDLYNVSISTFADIGNLVDSVENMFSSVVYWNPGLGIRYNTPIGPIRLDWAYPMHSPDSKWGRVYLSIGTIY